MEERASIIHEILINLMLIRYIFQSFKARQIVQLTVRIPVAPSLDLKICLKPKTLNIEHDLVPGS